MQQILGRQNLPMGQYFIAAAENRYPLRSDLLFQ